MINTLRRLALTAILPLVVSVAAAAQGPVKPVSPEVKQSEQNPLYKITINVVERTTKAINYRSRAGATKVDFRGTPLLPEAHGEAKVESKQGYIEVEVEFDELQGATRFGPEFLTYVMWAITPEGRASNLGEVILNGTESKLNVTTDLQAFGLIVTAEPYFGVTQPSDVVVMENFVRNDTLGAVEEIDAKYELLQRGQYVVNVAPADLKPMILDKDTPLDLLEARNAVRIARWSGADKHAADSFAKAEHLLKRAEDYKERDAGDKSVSMTSREAVQTAEDARIIALQRQEEDRVAAERAAAFQREAQAKADAQEAARLQAQAEQGQRLETERRARAEAEQRAAEALARLETESAARDKQAAQAAVERAEREKQQLRNALIQQLNLILETRDSARGLIVNLADVLFDTGKWTLKPIAREKLAKVSGIVLAHPGLTLQVEGHTDSVGTDEFNMTLSEKRATEVQTFLTSQGINPSAISARGMGETSPVATNDTAAGRQQNRRVELIVAGDVIGTPITLSINSAR